jgi:hypothetical protein
MKRMRIAPQAILIFVMLWSTCVVGAIGQGDIAPSAAILGAKIPDFDSTESTVQEGLEKLAYGPAPFAFGFENNLKSKFKDPPVPDVRFSLQLHDKTVGEILDALCRADPRYMWSIDGATINVYPLAIVGKPSYLMNRELKTLRIDGITYVHQGLFAIAQQLPPPTEQVAQVQSGAGGGEFPPEPWTAVFDNLTVRQAVNRLAAHIGPHGSWIFYGSEEFREFAFLEGVVPRTTPTWLSNLKPDAGVPVVSNLTLQESSFTTRVAGGIATFIATVTIGSVQAGDLPITYRVTRFAPANPSNVSLTEQSNQDTQEQCTISESPGTCSVSFPVASSEQNKNPGTVTWILLYNSNSRDAEFNTSPNPLNGTVTFTP